MKKLLIITAFISLAFADNSLFKKGNEAYQNRNYTLALEYYQQIENNELQAHWTPAVSPNLGWL